VSPSFIVVCTLVCTLLVLLRRGLALGNLRRGLGLMPCAFNLEAALSLAFRFGDFDFDIALEIFLVFASPVTGSINVQSSASTSTDRAATNAPAHEL
jgi:hypothetical protein